MADEVQATHSSLTLEEQADLLDQVNDTIMVRLLDGTITYWNQGAERMYGYTRAEAVGRLAHELLRTAFSARRRDIEKALLETGGWEGELQHRTKGGDALVIATRWVLKRDAKGEPHAVLEINNDITARKRAEEEREQQARLLAEQAQLLDLAHDAIMVRRFDGIIVYWNSGAEQMYGYPRAEAVGRSSHELLTTKSREDIAWIEKALLESGHWEGELEHVHRDGAVVLVESRWVAQRDGKGTIRAVMEINTDITARRRAEEARARQQEELIRAQSLAIAELSTPLIPITESILVMPLIGVVDSMRAKQVMESLLQGLASSRGQVVILDITGVPVVDTQVASTILRAAQAVRLLGAEMVITGIRPEVAQTLVSIGVELAGITTRGTLQSAIAFALRRAGGGGLLSSGEPSEDARRPSPFGARRSSS